MWYKKYFGMPYTDEFDCADLVRLIYKQELDIVLKFPQHRSTVSISSGNNLINKYIKINTEHNFIKINTEQLNDFDVAYIQHHRSAHLGTVFNHRGQLKIIHNVENTGVVSAAIDSLKIISLYRLKT